MARTPWICLGHCYVTGANQVQKVIEIDRMVVTYVERAGGKLAFPVG